MIKIKSILHFVFIFFLTVALSCKKSENISKPSSKDSFVELYKREYSNRLKDNPEIYTPKPKQIFQSQSLVQPPSPYTISETEAQEYITPILSPAVQYVQENYEINLLQYFTASDPRIAIVGSLALRIEDLLSTNRYVDTTYIELAPEVIVASLAAPPEVGGGPDWYDCALRSLGIEAAVKLSSSGMSNGLKATMKKSALRKIIIKIATRSLGFIGAIVATYEFGDCMDWW